MPDSVTLKSPRPENGFDVHALVAQCPPLDPNSLYCNLLQCSHFSATSVAAFLEDELVGFISGYLIPDRPDTLFIWQVAVSSKARGRGLATQMIEHILQRERCANVSYLETTITADNKASWSLFEGVARHHNTSCNSEVLFDKAVHFRSQHDSEELVRIGPFNI